VRENPRWATIVIGFILATPSRKLTVQSELAAGGGMALQDLTLRMWFLTLLAWAITILSIMSVTNLPKSDYSHSPIYLTLAGGLAVGFFRKRKIVLTIIGLTFILVSTRLTTIFHPTLPGIIVTAASCACLYLLAVWQAKKYPHLTRRNWQILFDHDPD
jgi:hypothetical protein